MDFNALSPNWDTDLRVKRAEAISAEIESYLGSGPLEMMEFGCGTGLISFHLKNKKAQFLLIDNSEGMIKEARELAKISPNIVVKIPMTLDGLSAVRVLSQEGIKTNVTLIFSVHQGVLAAKAGATYISPFVGRLDDIGLDGMDLINDLIIAKQNYGFKTEIIAASIRTKEHILQCILSGVDIATIPYAQIEDMAKHPLTTAGIERFISDYSKVQK